MWMLKILLGNLALVLVLELTAGIVWGVRDGRNIATMALVNVITNPVVVLGRLCLTLFFPRGETIGILVLELLAFLAEGVIYSGYKTFGKRNPYLVSLGLNGISFLAGEIINIFL